MADGECLKENLGLSIENSIFQQHILEWYPWYGEVELFAFNKALSITLWWSWKFWILFMTEITGSSREPPMLWPQLTPRENLGAPILNFGLNGYVRGGSVLWHKSSWVSILFYTCIMLLLLSRRLTWVCTYAFLAKESSFPFHPGIQVFYPIPWDDFNFWFSLASWVLVCTYVIIHLNLACFSFSPRFPLGFPF